MQIKADRILFSGLRCAAYASIVNVGTTPTSAALYGLTQRFVIDRLGFWKGVLPGTIAGIFVAKKIVDSDMDWLAALKLEGVAGFVFFHLAPFCIPQSDIGYSYPTIRPKVTLEEFIEKNF